MPQCPVCETPSNLLKDLPATFLKKSLSEYYRQQIPESVNVASYQLMRCPRCTAEFSEPAIPGDSSFYAWLAQKAGYYPKWRWEWSEVIAEINRHNTQPASLLEVGCGSGTFLEIVLGEPAIHAVGLDTELGAVGMCRGRGCEAHCEDIGAFLARNPGRRFDYVAAFHCLEHVPQPKEFLRAMLGALKPGGSVFTSTPYSPMSFETGWFDPLNHPPHHMTRWNARMYQEMAAQLGLNVRLRMPKAAGLLQRTKGAVILRKYGPQGASSKLQTLAALFGNPMGLLSEILTQRNRERREGNCTADVVLAEFSRASA